MPRRRTWLVVAASATPGEGIREFANLSAKITANSRSRSLASRTSANIAKDDVTPGNKVNSTVEDDLKILKMATRG